MKRNLIIAAIFTLLALLTFWAWHSSTPPLDKLEQQLHEPPPIQIAMEPVAASGGEDSPARTADGREKLGQVVFLRHRSAPKREAIAIKLLDPASPSSYRSLELPAGEETVSTFIKHGLYSIELGQDWKASATRVEAGDAPKIVKLYQASTRRFRLIKNGEPLVHAMAQPFSRSDGAPAEPPMRSTAEGVVSLDGVSTEGVLLIAWTDELLVGWRVNGVLPEDDHVVSELHVPLLADKRSFRIVSSDAAQPISNVQIEFADGSPAPLQAHGDGTLYVPSFGGSLPPIYASADGFERAWIDLERDSDLIELLAVQSFRVRVAGPNGEVDPEAELHAFIVDQGATSVNATTALSSQELEDGEFAVNLPVGTDLNTVLLLGRVPGQRFGIAKMSNLVPLVDKRGTRVLSVTRDPSLTVKLHAEGELSEASNVVARTFDGRSVEWSVDGAGIVFVKDALFLDYLRIETDSNLGAEIKRHPLFDSVDDCFRNNFESAVLGELLVPLSSTSEIRGVVQDPDGTPVISEELTFSAPRPERLENLRRFPDLDGHLPTDLEGWLIFQGQSVHRTVTDEFGRFLVPSASPGRYSVSFPSFTGEGAGQAFGPDLSQYSFSVPSSGFIVITTPHIFFADYLVQDIHSGAPIERGLIEFTYSDFLDGFNAVGRAFKGGQVKEWLGWTRGARLRISATGYYPSELILPGRQALDEVDKRVIQLQPPEPMTLDFGNRKNGESRRTIEAEFLRNPDLRGNSQVVSSAEYTVPESGVIELLAPFPGCIVSLRPSEPSSPAEETPIQFEYVPGGSRQVSWNPN